MGIVSEKRAALGEGVKRFSNRKNHWRGQRRPSVILVLL